MGRHADDAGIPPHENIDLIGFAGLVVGGEDNAFMFELIRCDIKMFSPVLIYSVHSIIITNKLQHNQLDFSFF